MSDKTAFLFALSAPSGSFDEGCLTLNDVPLVIYFSDRPERIVGHAPVAQFLALWDEGPDNFHDDPPNAELSILAKTGIEDIVIELLRPQPSDYSLAFDIRILSGHVPASFGAASLFIDEAINGGAWTGTLTQELLIAPQAKGQ